MRTKVTIQNFKACPAFIRGIVNERQIFSLKKKYMEARNYYPSLMPESSIAAENDSCLLLMFYAN